MVAAVLGFPFHKVSLLVSASVVLYQGHQCKGDKGDQRLDLFCSGSLWEEETLAQIDGGRGRVSGVMCGKTRAAMDPSVTKASHSPM